MRRRVVWWLIWCGAGIVLTAAASIGSQLTAQPSDDVILLLSSLYVAGILLTCSCCLTWYRLLVDARAGVLFMLGMYFEGISEGAAYFSQPRTVVEQAWNVGRLGASVVGLVLIFAGGCGWPVRSDWCVQRVAPQTPGKTAYPADMRSQMRRW